MPQFSYSCYTDKFTTISEIIEHMHSLQSELAASSLSGLCYFNNTYLQITQAVSEDIKRGHFQDYLRMQQFDIAFARYYFSALKNYVDRQPIPPAWQICFQNCQSNSYPPTILMSLGVNAHVNNDLPQTLADCNFGQSYGSDFYQVNKIIRLCTPRIITDLNNTKGLFFLLSKLPFFYHFLLYIIIFLWRHKAWKNHQKLLGNNISKEKIENQAQKIAKMLSDL